MNKDTFGELQEIRRSGYRRIATATRSRVKGNGWHVECEYRGKSVTRVYSRYVKTQAHAETILREWCRP